MLLAEHNLQRPLAAPPQAPPLPILLASFLLPSASVSVSHETTMESFKMNILKTIGGGG